MSTKYRSITITERAVTGLAVVLGLTLAGVIVAIPIVIVFIMKRRRTSQNTENTFTPLNGIYGTLLNGRCPYYVPFYT